uniref:N-acetylgalactosaminide beta-1,3-galactosyltransferase n=1 Tax=Chromera velia CCMP2878 TaxID=1169474 RepID=A0A0G4GT02_9ALVE|eukprot:Cvel_5167.t1-p1 / transcript=Cvel_5167.t1 / gene=Cvel_5167 / organism=Chromera_velia_CCMP2878 / gene_product=hypothetical protein / transcript_product=hypothetical protein / location=Cvel_scaffold237:39843-41249(+) / protein_length=469 / sequence_SO=supercontig / SO=protein_coding / is_pseudo=false
MAHFQSGLLGFCLALILLSPLLYQTVRKDKDFSHIPVKIIEKDEQPAVEVDSSDSHEVPSGESANGQEHVVQDSSSSANQTVSEKPGTSSVIAPLSVCHQNVSKSHKETDNHANPVVVYAIITKGGKLPGPIKKALDTWASDFPRERLVVLSDVNATTDNVVHVIPQHPAGGPCPDNYSSGLCCKTGFAFTILYSLFPEADFFVRLSDDAFAFPHHLEKSLRKFNPSERLYLGVAGTALMEGGWLSVWGEPHASGGPGIIFSRSLAQWWSDTGAAADFLSTCSHDDAWLGAFLRVSLNLVVTHLPGVIQSPDLKYAREKPSQIFSDPDKLPPCSAPLPGPSLYIIPERSYGLLYPFTPLDWEDVLILHVPSSNGWWERVHAVDLTVSEREQRCKETGGAGQDCGKKLLLYLNKPRWQLQKQNFGVKSPRAQTESLALCEFSEFQRRSDWQTLSKLVQNKLKKPKKKTMI